MMNYLKTPEVVKGYEEFMLPRITFLQMEHEILNGEGVEDQLKAKEDLKITINLMRTLNMNKQDYETYKNENLKNEKTEGENEGDSSTVTAPKKRGSRRRNQESNRRHQFCDAISKETKGESTGSPTARSSHNKGRDRQIQENQR